MLRCPGGEAGGEADGLEQVTGSEPHGQGGLVGLTELVEEGLGEPGIGDDEGSGLVGEPGEQGVSVSTLIDVLVFMVFDGRGSEEELTDRNRHPCRSWT